MLSSEKLLKYGKLTEFFEDGTRNPGSPITVYKQLSCSKVKKWTGSIFTVDDYPITKLEYYEIFDTYDEVIINFFWEKELNQSEIEAISIRNNEEEDFEFDIEDEDTKVFINDQYEEESEYEDFHEYDYLHDDPPPARGFDIRDKLSFFKKKDAIINDIFIEAIQGEFFQEQPQAEELQKELEKENITKEEIVTAASHVVFNYEGNDFKKSKILKESAFLINSDEANKEYNFLNPTKLDYDRFLIINRIVQNFTNGSYEKGDRLVDIYHDFLKIVNYNNRNYRLRIKRRDKSTEIDNKYKAEIRIILEDIERMEIDFDEYEKIVFKAFWNPGIIKRVKAVLIPSGGGKTTIFKNFFRSTLDIDYLRELFDNEKLFYFCHQYSLRFKRWNVINKLWQHIVYQYQHLLRDRILMCHSIHQINCEQIDAMGIIPHHNDSYDKRFFKMNSSSIKQEVKYKEVNIDNMFYEIMCFYRDSF